MTIEEEIRQAIAKLGVDGPEQSHARSRLVEIGAPAVPAVVEAIRVADAGSLRWLCWSFLHIADERILPTVVKLLDDDNADLRTAAYTWLGQCSNQLAFDALCQKLLEKPSRQILAIRALGNRGDRRALEPLKATTRDVALTTPDRVQLRRDLEVLQPSNFMLGMWLDVAVALAKLGEQETSQFVLGVLDYGRGQDDDGWEIRMKATEALQSVVGPGVFQAFCDALQASDSEIVELGLTGLLYLGAKGAVPAIISLIAKDPESYVSELALTQLYELTGEFPLGKESATELTGEELEAWWKEREGHFSSGACMRFGKPLSVPDIIAVLKGDQRYFNSVATELYMITGNGFGYDYEVPREEQVDNIHALANRWWQAESHRFQAGRLYKYGFPQNLSAAMASA